MKNKDEFIIESKPIMQTNTTPEVPQKCGSVIGVELSNLSKTQKKKMKAKAKEKSINTVIKNFESSDIDINPLGNRCEVNPFKNFSQN